ncbi:efflux RND transporter periplasmic adaptor subunit [Luteimonas sp. 100069]|uniref:HlyD family secretion protein n=1 Tax=Luteimonas sp. 100069 TaxID=2006109 RepID=UPI000F4ED5CD|nr:efflux RND transporter periplasmic adaptor subunit [Luteimonas sp. 100069]RPD85281.1 biotin/lipoyl-binding protein [Luteimonas sp. 100069]
MIPTRPRARHLVFWLVLLGLVLFVIVGLYLAMRPAPPQIQGMVDADTYNVAPKAIARVEVMYAEEGQRVARGELLAELSSPEIQAADQQANAALQGAEAARELADEGARVEDVRSAEAVWKAARAASALAARTARRADNLFAEGVISAQRRDEADAAREASAAQAEAARQQYLKLAAGVREPTRALAESQVEAALAGVFEATALEKETHLLSPIDGEIAERFVQPGELVLLGVPVYTIIDIDHPYVSFPVRESQYAGLANGVVILGNVPALDLEGVAFEVDFIDPQGDFATWRATRQSRGYDMRSFEVRARPREPVEGLRPGMSVLLDWPPRR